jgi:hypothetical protein
LAVIYVVFDEPIYRFVRSGEGWLLALGGVGIVVGVLYILGGFTSESLEVAAQHSIPVSEDEANQMSPVVQEMFTGIADGASNIVFKAFSEPPTDPNKTYQSYGTVVEVNEKLRKDPTLINRSPYEEGWILKIQAKGLNKEMPELMDSFQFKAHFDQCKARLMSFFNNQTLGLAYGDGEEVIKGIAGKLDEKMWKILVTQLFHSSPE